MAGDSQITLSFPDDEEEIPSANAIDLRNGVKYLVDSAPRMKQLPPEFVLRVQRSLAVHSDDIPIIDLGGIIHGSYECRKSVAGAIGDACVNWGFFRVKNHGIDGKLIEEMVREVEGFFGMCLEEKMKYHSEDVLSPIRYGTSLNTSMKHSLHWRDYFRHFGHPFHKSLHLWPQNPPNYRNVVKAYLEQVWNLAMKIIGVISESLGLEAGYIETTLGEGIQILACNYYPPCPEPDKTLGLAPHSDHGALTILTQNQVDGLQIKHKDAWISIQHVPETLLVNIGDYLEIVSNGKYQSVEHLAVVNQLKTRISIAVGHGPDLDATMRPATPLVRENEVIQYRPIVYKDYMKLQQSSTVRGKTSLEAIRIK